MSISKKTFRFAASLLITSSLFSAAAMAAEPASKSDTPAATQAVPTNDTSSLEKADKSTVLATVNGQNITIGDVLDARKLLPAQLSQIPTGVLLPMMVDQMVDQKAIQQMAEKANLENNPEVQQQLKLAKASIIQDAYLKAQVEPKITPEAIKKFYDENFANKPPVKEAHIRHILVKTQAEAEKIIKELKAGKKFADLAKASSIDKATAGQNGGDLGWVKADELVPDFSKAAFAMKANTTSTTPVKSPFGYHVIQVLAYKDVPVPPLDKVTPMIRQKLIQQNVKAVIDDTVKQSKITKNDAIIKKYTIQPPSAPGSAQTPAK
ncbi:peptidylprolyl isomerase [Commensalibacter nepenthis]|uniref:Parvulin-like PPIase n=1 Tax=Commensalibacter nepenthis TaxID=3043872 RepID=A0ABT6Q973_9PROT|nr:peptidylprolyl isomerase [Commensalibacter sp. TBRC 10068]MDI2113341.1 peptidylprolyl isomerase [Commensalibacter sp. TBRC 10068]